MTDEMCKGCRKVMIIPDDWMDYGGETSEIKIMTAAMVKKKIKMKRVKFTCRCGHVNYKSVMEGGGEA